MKTILPANIERWTKVGEPTVLAKKYGAYLLLQRFRSPDGQEEEYSIFGGKNWAMVCAITEEGNLVLVRQYKQGVDDQVIEFAAGTAEGEEDLALTATRELLEETGYLASQVIPVGHRHFISTRKSVNYFCVFLAVGCKFTGSRRLDATESIEVLEATPQEFWQMVHAGEIYEPATIVAATHAALAGHIPMAQ